MADYTTNENPTHLIFLADKNLIPEYAGNCERITPDSVKDYVDETFADPVNREYPCHTKAACWHAATEAFATNKSAALVDEILNRAELFGCREDCENAISALRGDQEKSASAEVVEEQPMTKFALCVDLTGFQDRGVEYHYPIETAEDVVGSATDMMQDFREHRLPMQAMRKAAKALIKQANELNVPMHRVSGFVQRMGVQGTPEQDSIDMFLTLRKSAGVDIDPYKQITQQMMEGIAKAASVMAAETIAEEAGDALCALDNEYGLQYMGPGAYLTPYESIMTGPATDTLIKIASTCVDVGGVQIPAAEIIGLSDRTIDSVFSKEAAANVKAAKQALQEDINFNNTDAATEYIANLNNEAQMVLLDKLCNRA